MDLSRSSRADRRPVNAATEHTSNRRDRSKVAAISMDV